MNPSTRNVSMPGEAWHHRPAEEVLTQLGSTPTGLSAVEAAHRLAKDGPNGLKEAKQISGWRILARQFKSLVIWILVAAGVRSGVLGELVEAFAILAVMVVNAAIGFCQEFKAEQSIAALKLMTATQAKVLRDGSLVEIPATGLVVGDVLALEAGDLVAADARLLKLASLTCIESSRTPEAARSHAFATPVFAELLRAFGARSETKPVWHIPLFSNRNLVLVVAVSFGLQLLSQHDAMLGRFHKTPAIPVAEILMLLGIGAIPLAVLELLMIIRPTHRETTAHH